MVEGREGFFRRGWHFFGASDAIAGHGGRGMGSFGEATLPDSTYLRGEDRRAPVHKGGFEDDESQCRGEYGGIRSYV